MRSRSRMSVQIKNIAGLFVVAASVLGLLFCSAVNPPKVAAVPSYARQTGLPCSGCHYNPPELNPAGRKFKLTGYVDRADETNFIIVDGRKSHAPLYIKASLPRSVMIYALFNSTES